MELKNLTIDKILNHNTLICLSNDNEKYILFGKGVGFNKKTGTPFENHNNVEDFMMILDDSKIEEYNDLLRKVTDEKLVSLVQRVVNAANKTFSNKVDLRLHYTLLDHLNFTLERQKQNIKIEYPFLNELQYTYPKEYEFSKKALAYLNKNYTEKFPVSELGFITLHIHAAIKDTKVSNVVLANQICHEAIEIIENKCGEMVDVKSINYMRFKQHLQSSIHRVKNDIKIENIILDSIRDKCPKEFEIAKEIGKLLIEKYYLKFTDDELGYLTLHIYNLTSTN